MKQESPNQGVQARFSMKGRTMAGKEEKIGRLGKVLIETLKNQPLDWFDVTCSGEGVSSRDRLAARVLPQLPAETMELIKDSVNRAVTGAVYDLLEKLYEIWSDEEGIEVLIDGENIFDIDADMKMRVFGENSWDVKFGTHPSWDELTEKYDKRYNKMRREGLITE